LHFFLGILLAVSLCEPAVWAVPIATEIAMPVEAEAGQPILVWINLSSEVPVYEVLLNYYNPGTGQMGYEFMTLTAGNSTSGTWTYVIPAQPWEGELECRITAKDETGASAQFPESGPATIGIIGEEEPDEFPWNLVVAIIFLAVVLVITELIFKPGLYRPTGRDRAKALEEEDRKKEQAEKKDNCDDES